MLAQLRGRDKFAILSEVLGGKPSRREDGRVIRFACPGCKSFLSGKDELAGKIVTCPKCGQRMQTSRLRHAAREKITHRSRRLLSAGIPLAAVLSLAAVGGGIWLSTHFPNREPLSEIAAAKTTEPSSKSSREASSATENQIRAATVRERQEEQPLPNGRGAEKSSRPSQKPTDDKPPPPEDPKKIDLADDRSPELSFDLVDAINVQRAKAKVGPIFLDAELSRACQSRAEQLARHAGPRGNREKELVAEEAPLAAIEKWLQEPKSRTAILETRLRTFGAGFARNVDGQWFSVFDWTSRLDREPEMATTPVTGAIVYPAPGQTRVSLWFPGNELPDPLPQTKDKLAGYPVTLIFPSRARIEEAAAHLSNKEERDVAVWLSTPEKPANPKHADLQQNTICLIAKNPLLPNTRYHVEVSAKVNGEAWSAKWDFITVSEGEIHQEMAGSFLRMLNRLRRSAGLPSVPLDTERSKACSSHAGYLSRNISNNPKLNWNDEKSDLPGYTNEGAAAARTASIQGGGGPIEAVMGLIDSLISRPQLLDPHLGPLGLGYTPFIQGGWIWVIDMHRTSSEKEEGHEGADKEYFYPAPDQESVPLVYPPNEVPSPIPAGAKDKLAGYAITALFGPRARVTAATAKLADAKGNEVDGWLSTPEKPSIAGFSQRSLCFLPKAPLRPNTRYTATFRAEVNDRSWQRKWSFTTLKEPDRYSDDLEEKIAEQVNAARKAAGLTPVRLDAELSRGCQSHAHYLALNHQRPETLGARVHREDAQLPGASPEGARAAKESVIAVILDPQACVENWMATLYHRIPILAPNLERIGFGHARIHGHKWVCVLDTGNGRTPQDR